MNSGNELSEQAARLRKRAEEQAAALPETFAAMPPEETRRMFHELLVHQIELEMQNEELRRIQVELDAARERYFELYELAPSGYCTINEHGLIQEANLKTAALLGAPRNALLKQPVSRFILKEDQDIYYLRSKQLLKNDEPQAFELRMVKMDGTMFHGRLEANSALDTEGNAVCHIALSDVTGRKHAENALKDNLDLLRIAGAMARFGGWSVNLEENRVVWSDEVAAIHGVPPGHSPSVEEAISFYAPEWREKITKAFAECAEKGIPYNEEMEIITVQGKLVWAQTSGEAVRDDRGKIIKMHGAFQDITGLKQAEQEIELKNEELVKLNAEKDKFFSIIAHDLRSPFNSFLGLTQIMSEELPRLTMDEIQKIAVGMRSSASHLFQLLENLLHWARAQQGLIPFNPAIAQLRSILNESMEMIQEHAKTKEIGITCVIPDGIQVFADSNMLQTVIRNLVSNAIKFTHKGGKITISAKAAADQSVEISVKDTGIGMNHKIADNIFRIDVRTNRKGTDGEPSSGIGLLLCKEFVGKHGGRIWAESEEGKGSTFHFTVPRNTEPEEKNSVENAAPADEKANNPEPLKVLIAEDDENSEGSFSF